MVQHYEFVTESFYLGIKLHIKKKKHKAFIFCFHSSHCINCSKRTPYNFPYEKIEGFSLFPYSPNQAPYKPRYLCFPQANLLWLKEMKLLNMINKNPSFKKLITHLMHQKLFDSYTKSIMTQTKSLFNAKVKTLGQDNECH